MRFKYFLQKLFGTFLNEPIFLPNKTVGFSLVKSERENCFLGEHARVYSPFNLHNIRLGDYSYIAHNSLVGNCEIGKFCSIGPHFCCGLGIHPITGISTSPMFYSVAKQNGVALCDENKFEESSHTVIGNDVFIGANVTVLDGVHIGDGAVIGAGAVVTKDIPPYAVAVGVPAEVRKYRFDEKTIHSLLRKQWWDGTAEDIKRVEEYFWDVDGFLNCEV